MWRPACVLAKSFTRNFVKTEEFDKTENSLIFIEKDTPLSRAEIDRCLNILEAACDSGSDEAVRRALKQVVPTYRSPKRSTPMQNGRRR